jgi:hypothetical protein
VEHAARDGGAANFEKLLRAALHELSAPGQKGTRGSRA